MTGDKEEAEKRELHKLLLEYNANSGMAGMVCSRPVELMPESDQDRIIGGFCTPGNLEVLSISRKKLELAKNLDLTESEISKIDRAIPTLDGLIEAFTDYSDSHLSKDELREKVRKILYKPIPESQEGLIDALSRLIETLEFLATQPLDTKDSWDRMVDCVQMHDALSRAKEVCTALQPLTTNEGEQVAKRSGALDETLTVANASLEFLESFFKGDTKDEDLQNHFAALSDGLKNIWIDGD